MRKFLISGLFLVGILFLAGNLRAQSNDVIVLQIEGPVMPTMVNYFERGIETAVAQDATAVLIELDTPGGAVDTTQEIVQLFRAAPIPIIIYVSPRGAQAASAGSIITMAGHAAAMAPETVIGAASPVGEGGAELGETIFRKVTEDLKATVRNLTADRGEEATELAEDMIENARAVTAEEALAIGLIDVIGEDVADVLSQLDGKTVMVDNEPVVLNTGSATTQPLPMTGIEQVLLALVSPVLLGILLTIGVQAILIELSSPGGWIAGLIGILSIGLAMYGLGQLPVNWLGLGLIVVAFVLYVMEAKAATHGALALTATVILIAGLLVLFNSPTTPEFIRLSIPAAIAIGGATTVFFLFIAGKALGAQRIQPATGAEGLIGQIGPVRTPLTSTDHKAPYNGMVLVAGELWRAQADEEVGKDDQVMVTAVDGVKLHVKKATS